jgi:hypothetical protein
MMVRFREEEGEKGAQANITPYRKWNLDCTWI